MRLRATLWDGFVGSDVGFSAATSGDLVWATEVTGVPVVGRSTTFCDTVQVWHERFLFAWMTRPTRPYEASKRPA